MNAAFKGITEGMYAEVAFTKYTGTTEIFETIEYKDMEASGSYRIITVDDLVISDSNQLVTITIRNADTSVYSVCKESMNSYFARSIGNNTDANRISEMAAKFTASAHAYTTTK